MHKIDQEIKKNIKVILGQLGISNKVSKIFDNLTVDFLNQISKEIFKNSNYLELQDLVTFAFWIRKKNILNLSKKYSLKNNMIGHGTIFHITPSNVPMNFAYSLTFGLLSGNNNILRLPTKNFIQINVLCKIIKKLLKYKKYKKINKKICLIKYEKLDFISSYFSKLADVRLIWGGDKTINQFKKYTTSPRCIDLSFPDRYSISVLGINNLIKTSSLELDRIVERFYNDTYRVVELCSLFGCYFLNSLSKHI